MESEAFSFGVAAMDPDLNESRPKKSKLVRFADECDSEADSDIPSDETDETNEEEKLPADGDYEELEEGLDEEEEDMMEEKKSNSSSEAEEESEKKIKKVLGHENKKVVRKGKKQNNLREDIYGRLVDESGTVISPSTSGGFGRFFSLSSLTV